MEPLILTVGKLRSVLDGLLQQCEARGRRVLGATSEEELRGFLENQEVAAVVLGGGLPEAERVRYREIIGAQRPGLSIHQHAHGGPAGLIEVVDQVAKTLKG